MGASTPPPTTASTTARNPQYIDKNHAGTLIVWDRLFGTFAEEKEECVYGITTPLESWNPVWANFHYWAELAEQGATDPEARGRPPDLRQGARLAARGPGRLRARPRGERRRRIGSTTTSTPRGLLVYVFLQFVVVNLAALVFFFQSGSWAALPKIAAALALVVTLASLGGLLDRRGWATGLEVARLLLATVAASFLWSSAAARRRRRRRRLGGQPRLAAAPAPGSSAPTSDVPRAA